MISKLLILTLLTGCCLALYPKRKEHFYPKSYEFGYDISDKYGNSQSRQESGDDYGKVIGEYSYNLGNGIFRRVKYMADKYGGFRAYIKSNEPGMGKESPASVKSTIFEPPMKLYKVKMPVYDHPIKVKH